MIGREISHYRVIERLGAGGMGVVYKAQDNTLGRYVALKFLPSPVTGDSQGLDRFLREARAAAALNHPNICTIYEVSGALPEPFIAMEYLEGKTLRERISGQPLPQDLLIDLAVQLADALAAAHDRHIIHRDIKPANIFITRNDQAKILDFGLAKITQGHMSLEDQTTFSGGSAVTSPGTTVGTVFYMSPEQARGEELDHRSDIFSLGAVLYEMASGRIAFEGNTAAVIYNAILSLSPAPLNQLNPGLSPDLIRIISRCLEKNRDLRYQNAADLRSDLRRLKRDSESQVFAAGSGPVAAPKRKLSIWKKTAALAGLIIIGGVAMMYVSRLTGGAEVMKESDVIVLTDFVNRTGDPVFDGTLKQALALKLEESPFLNVFSEQRTRETLAFMRRSTEEKVTPDLGREVCQRQNLKAMMTGEIAPLGSQYVITLNATNCDTGEVLARDQVQAASKEDVLNALGQATMHMRESLGESLRSIERMNARIEEATTGSLEALKAFTAAELQRSRGADQEAIPLFERAIELDPMFAVAHGRLGVIRNNRGDRDEAVRLLTKAYELRERVSERERLYVTAHYQNTVESDPEKAITTYKLWRQTYPRDYIPAVNLGNIYLASGRLKEAVVQLEEAIQLNPVPTAFSNLTATYSNLGETDKMVAAYKLWMEKLPLDGNPHAQISHYYRSIGQYEQALTSTQKAVELEPVAQFYAILIRSLIDVDRYEEAKATAAKAFAAKLDNADAHVFIYLLATHEGDTETLKREAPWWKGNQFEPFFIGFEGSSLATDGRFRQARVLLDRSLEMGKQTGSMPLVERFLTSEASLRALFGDKARARDGIQNALKVSRSRSVLTNAAPVLAAAGDEEGAAAVLAELTTKFPNDVMLKKVLAPTVRAAMALLHNRSDEALNLLKEPAPYVDYGVDYVRGLALAQAGRHNDAIAEFKKIIDHPGAALTSNPMMYRMAHLGIARSYSAAGDKAGAGQFYARFLSFFKNADPGLPILDQARAENAKLQGS